MQVFIGYIVGKISNVSSRVLTFKISNNLNIPSWFSGPDVTANLIKPFQTAEPNTYHLVFENLSKIQTQIQMTCKASLQRH